MAFIRTTGYSTLLKGPFERIGYNWDDPKRVDPACNKKLGFKSKPKPSVDLSFEWKDETAEKFDEEDTAATYLYTDA